MNRFLKKLGRRVRITGQRDDRRAVLGRDIRPGSQTTGRPTHSQPVNIFWPVSSTFRASRSAAPEPGSYGGMIEFTSIAPTESKISIVPMPTRWHGARVAPMCGVFVVIPAQGPQRPSRVSLSARFQAARVPKGCRVDALRRSTGCRE